MIITLTGFMGCGKSSIGREFAELLGRPFVDLDEQVESAAGMSIPQIFAEQGEEAFRSQELAALGEVFENEALSDCVLALGGGTVMNEAAAELVSQNSICIYLRADFDTLFENLSADFEQRPMLAGANNLKTRIEELMSSRADTYEACADIMVDIDGLGTQDAAELLVEAIEGYGED